MLRTASKQCLIASFVVALWLVGTSGVAKERTTIADNRKIELPIEEWLSQGERADFPWKVRIERPVLTFQQRNLVRVIAEIPVPTLQSRSISRDLHFIIKVADENGKWLEGESTSQLPISDKLDDRADVQMEDEFHLLPGAFLVAIIAYDSVLGERNLALRRLTLKPPDRDPLPELLHNLPKVEFLPVPVKGLETLGHGHLSLPVATRRELQLDLIVDLPDGGHPRPPHAQWIRRGIGATPETQSHRNYSNRLIESASVLSELNLQNGCTRVTALDVASRRVLIAAQPADAVDWEKTQDEVLGTKLVMVSVSDLTGRRESANFFRDQLEQLMSQGPQCSLNSSRPLHVVAILSGGRRFPYGSSRPKVQPKCDCKIFYLRQQDEILDLGDDLEGMLKSLSPKVLKFRDPFQFRSRLFDFIRVLEKLSGAN